VYRLLARQFTTIHWSFPRQLPIRCGIFDISLFQMRVERNYIGAWRFSFSLSFSLSLSLPGKSSRIGFRPLINVHHSSRKHLFRTLSKFRWRIARSLVQQATAICKSRWSKFDAWRTESIFVVNWKYLNAKLFMTKWNIFSENNYFTHSCKRSFLDFSCKNKWKFMLE